MSESPPKSPAAAPSQAIRKGRRRVLLALGEVVPYALGEALQARLPRARFLRIRGGSHNVADPAARDAMLDFVDEVTPSTRR